MSATYPGQTDEPVRRPHALVRAALAVERAERVDAIARRLQPVAEALVRSPRRRDLLRGQWLGHSAHPFFVTVPLGIWTGVSVLDVVGGDATRDATRTLTGLGVLVGIPSALTGLAEWTGTNTRDRRTATVHAMANATGLACYTGSWWARRRGSHAVGAVLAGTGYAFVNVGGFLGGHLTEGRKVGSHHAAIASD